jgi:dienelactone hydrolase
VDTGDLDDPLTDFHLREIEIEGIRKRVYVSGQGPGVIVMAEMPGISPHVARFARWVRGAGFAVYMPSLFGRDGALPRAEEGIEILKRACISAEFRALGGNASSPVSKWLRGLARVALAECGGPGVGAVGMCFTGNFALTMMLEPAMLAPVLAQPSLPLDVPGGLEISARELRQIRERLEREDLTVLALRFQGDRYCRSERFEAYRSALGSRFTERVLPDVAANADPPPFFKDVIRSPHSVLTAHLVDREGEPTVAARDAVLDFLRSRLYRDAPDVVESIL